MAQAPDQSMTERQPGPEETIMTPRVDSTLHKGLQILETLAASQATLGITDLSNALSLNKSNIHRLVKTLCTLGYVTQCPDRSYRASLKIWKLGSMVMNHTNLARLALNAMNSLTQASGESVHLSVLDGLKVLYIEKIDSAQSVRAYTQRGGTAPLHCVATGKALLAYNYESLRGPISHVLEAFTPKTITSLKALDAEMASIRQSGIAINSGEYRADVGGIAAPILDMDGNILAAIGISGPLSRLPRSKMKELPPLVTAAAKSVSDLIKLRKT
jgi:IclR family transcriptional regulator, KDG regulon repressor